MHRRTLLIGLSFGPLSLAGCLGSADNPGEDETSPTKTATKDSGTVSDASPGPDDGTESTDRPAACPTSQELGVEWPTELDESTVKSFVEDYEDAYYREVVIKYDPESQLGEYDLGGSLTSSPPLKGEDSPKGIFRLRVSSGLKYAFAWAVNGRRPVVTKDVLFSACSPVNGAFLPAYSGRQQRGTTFHEQSGGAR